MYSGMLLNYKLSVCYIELTLWEIDLVGVDLMGVDFVGVDHMGGHHLIYVPQQFLHSSYRLCIAICLP